MYILENRNYFDLLEGGIFTPDEFQAKEQMVRGYSGLPEAEGLTLELELAYELGKYLKKEDLSYVF